MAIISGVPRVYRPKLEIVFLLFRANLDVSIVWENMGDIWVVNGDEDMEVALIKLIFSPCSCRLCDDSTRKAMECDHMVDVYRK